MENLFYLLNEVPFPSMTEHPGIKMRITLGFFDPKTSFFQSKIPNDLFSTMDVSARGIKLQPAGHADAFRGFEKFVRVRSTPFDLRIDFVLSERQAVFVHEPTQSVQAICTQPFLQPMCDALENLLLSMSDEGVISFL
jgi:hypothetical protein